MTTTVRGTVQLPPDDLPDQEVTVVLRLEDIGRADAAAEVVAERTFTATMTGSDPASLAFELPVEEERLDPRGTYSLRCHVDTTGSGSVERGDYLTTALHLLTLPVGDEPVSVRVQRI